MSRYSLVADRCLSSHEQETKRARGAWAFAIANPGGIMITSGRQRREFMSGQISLIIFASWWTKFNDTVVDDYYGNSKFLQSKTFLEFWRTWIILLSKNLIYLRFLIILALLNSIPSIDSTRSVFKKQDL